MAAGTKVQGDPTCGCDRKALWRNFSWKVVNKEEKKKKKNGEMKKKCYVTE